MVKYALFTSSLTIFEIFRFCKNLRGSERLETLVLGLDTVICNVQLNNILCSNWMFNLLFFNGEHKLQLTTSSKKKSFHRRPNLQQKAGKFCGLFEHQNQSSLSYFFKTGQNSHHSVEN